MSVAGTTAPTSSPTSVSADAGPAGCLDQAGVRMHAVPLELAFRFLSFLSESWMLEAETQPLTMEELDALATARVTPSPKINTFLQVTPPEDKQTLRRLKARSNAMALTFDEEFKKDQAKRAEDSSRLIMMCQSCMLWVVLNFRPPLCRTLLWRKLLWRELLWRMSKTRRPVLLQPSWRSRLACSTACGQS